MSLNLLLSVAGGQSVAQRSLIPSEREQFFLGEVEQRALQHDGEREIVLRQQQGVGEIHQIDDRNVFGKFEPVCAGYGMPACFNAWITASNRLPRRRPAPARRHG